MLAGTAMRGPFDPDGGHCPMRATHDRQGPLAVRTVLLGEGFASKAKELGSNPSGPVSNREKTMTIEDYVEALLALEQSYPDCKEPLERANKIGDECRVLYGNTFGVQALSLLRLKTTQLINNRHPLYVC